MRSLHCIIQPVEYVEVPLDDIVSIGVLLVYRLTPQFVSHFVVLGITDIIRLACINIVLLKFAFRQTGSREEMVYNLAVILTFVHTVRQRIIANKFINDCLKDNIKVFYEQVLSAVGAYIHLLALFKESITEIP